MSKKIKELRENNFMIAQKVSTQAPDAKTWKLAYLILINKLIML